MRNFKWNGSSIPFPNTAIEYGFQRIQTEDSGRTEDGTMDIKQVKDGGVRTIDCKWINCPDDVSRVLLSAIVSNTYGMLTYPDPISGSDKTYEFYTGDIKTTLKLLKGNICYWDISISFVQKKIEV